MAIQQFGFLVPGNYTEDDPHTGLEAALQLFELGERLGYDSAWPIPNFSSWTSRSARSTP